MPPDELDELDVETPPMRNFLSNKANDIQVKGLTKTQTINMVPKGEKGGDRVGVGGERGEDGWVDYVWGMCIGVFRCSW